MRGLDSRLIASAPCVELVRRLLLKGCILLLWGLNTYFLSSLENLRVVEASWLEWFKTAFIGEGCKWMEKADRVEETKHRLLKDREEQNIHFNQPVVNTGAVSC